MDLDLPYWFKQRQCKTEELSTGTYKVTGPNLNPGIVSVRMHENLGWQAALKADASGPDLEVSEATYPNAREALAAAFELFRTHMIIG